MSLYDAPFSIRVTPQPSESVRLRDGDVVLRSESFVLSLERSGHAVLKTERRLTGATMRDWHRRQEIAQGVMWLCDQVDRSDAEEKIVRLSEREIAYIAQLVGAVDPPRRLQPNPCLPVLLDPNTCQHFEDAEDALLKKLGVSRRAEDAANTEDKDTPE